MSYGGDSQLVNSRIKPYIFAFSADCDPIIQEKVANDKRFYDRIDKMNPKNLKRLLKLSNKNF